jgi:BirA family biotin operon repressor/biotin-[acetyl-CoA-carboxylase] ligase
MNNTGRFIVLNPDSLHQIGGFTRRGSAMLDSFLSQADVTNSNGAADFEQDGICGKILAEGLKADIFICAECSSTFDVAWLLAKHNLLPEWASVLSLRQTSGRGQLRRNWYSPFGNLYASMRLPEMFLREAAAPVLTALLFVEAFARLGLKLKFKWPNDLVLCAGRAGNTPGKLGGLLLEERDNILLVGAGINCIRKPAANLLRENTALRAVSLPKYFFLRSPISLWVKLVQNLFFVYCEMFTTTSVQQLLLQSEDCLLWKGSKVQVFGAFNDDSVTTGLLCGLTGQGGLRLLMSCPHCKEIALYSGSLKSEQ